MICSKCGKETDDMLSVCEHCGEPKDNNAVLLKKTDDSPTVLIENEKSYDEENTILLEEDEDDGRFISGVLDADQSIKTASDDKFFANNDYVPSASDEKQNRRNTFNDNDSTMSFDAIDGIEYIEDEDPTNEKLVSEETESVSEEKSEKNGKNQKTPKLSFLRTFTAVLLSAVTVIFMLVFNSALCIKLGMSGNIVRNSVNQLDPKTLLSSEFSGNELSDTLFNSLGFADTAGGLATPNSFRTYMMKSDFISYIGRNADNYINYIIDGKGKDPSVTAEDFVSDFIKANNRASIETFEYKMTEDDYQLMQRNLEKDNFDSALSISEWSSKINFNLKNAKYLFSYITIAVFFLAAVVMFIWTGIAADGKAKHITGFYSRILKTAGSITVITGALIIIGSAVAYAFTNNAVFYVISHTFITFSLIVLCVGIAEFILGLIFRTINKNIINTEQNL